MTALGATERLREYADNCGSTFRPLRWCQILHDRLREIREIRVIEVQLLKLIGCEKKPDPSDA